MELQQTPGCSTNLSVEDNSVETTNDAMEMVFRLTRFEMQYPKFARQKAEEIINKEIVDPIRAKMEQKGYSKKIIERVRTKFVAIDTEGFIDFDIISDFETDEGFDVAKMMEEGRVAYRILPKIKDLLKWIFLGRWVSKHKVDMPARPGDDFLFWTTLDEMEQKAQDRLNDEIDNQLAYNLEN